MTTGTHIAYYHICHRKLWLSYHSLQMEQHSDLVKEGKLIHENSYPQRASKYKEVAIEKIKIDHYDAQNQVIREVKKSKKKEAAHIAQVQFYIHVLQRNGIPVQYALLEYPTLRETETILPDPDNAQKIERWETEIEQITSRLNCPEIPVKAPCRKCAYHDFCYS